MSVVYPVSRGVAPVLVLAFGAGRARRGRVGALRRPACSRCPAACSLVVGWTHGGRSTARRDLFFGLAIAVTIAAYTLVDAEGVEHAARRPTCLMLAPSALVYAALLCPAAARGSCAPS